MVRNQDFYDKAGPDGLRSFGNVISIDDCVDLVRIHSQLSAANHILEIGAGYGRVINYVQSTYPEKKISAVETAPSMQEYLAKNYPDITLHRQSITKLDIPEIPNLVLWMWSGLGDLPQDQQYHALKKIHHGTAEEAVLVIDLPNIEVLVENGKNGLVGDVGDINRVSITHPQFGIYAGYFPTKSEMYILCEECGFSGSCNEYNINGSPRHQFVLLKT